ncbi:MAG TPA: SDR family oxidoreductase [Nitrospiria bacterium]|nr:SDR family oxidoreductase [Nitrospiria bacterium]
MTVNYLVTGGAGFIGSSIVAALAARGERVRVLDDFSTGKEANLTPYRDRVDLIRGDIRDERACAAAMRGVRFVFHQAALRSVPRSVDDPLSTDAVNVHGSLVVLQSARIAGVERLVYASSSSVYGDNPALPKEESMTPLPRSPYAVSKLTAEYYCRVYAQTFGLSTVSLRYFNVYGPGQDPMSQYAAVIPLFMDALQHGTAAIVHGDGEQSRDFTYIDDCVQANLLACTAPDIDGEVFNIAYGAKTSVNQIYTQLSTLMGRNISPRHEPPRAGDVRHTLADLTKARERLGYRPTTDIAVGLDKTVRWFLNRVGG